MAVLEFEFKGIDQNFRSSASNVLNDIDKIKKAFGSIGVGIGVDLKTALDGQKVALNDTKIQTQELVKAGKELDNQNKQTRNSIAKLNEEQKRYNATQRETRDALKAVSSERPYTQLTAEMNRVRKEAQDLGAQMIRLEMAGDKTSAEYIQLAAAFKTAQQALNPLDTGVKKLDSTLGQHQRNVGNYQNKMSDANGVTMEFNRIIQDAPFGMMGIGNNIQQLAANWQHYAQQQRTAADGSKIAVSNMSLLSGAIGGILSPVNLLSLGVSVVTSAWVIYDREQQKASKSVKEANKNVVDLLQSIKEQTSVMGQASAQAQANYASEENKLKSLWRITQDTTSSVKSRGNALNELKNLYPSIFEKYDLETIKTKNATNAYMDLTKAIQLSAKARSFEAKLAEQFGKQFDLQQFIKENRDKYSNMNRLIAEQKQFAGKSGLDIIADLTGFSSLIGIQQPLEDYNKGMEEFQKTLTALGKTDDEIKALSSELDNLYKSQANGAGFGDFKKNVTSTNTQLKDQRDYLLEIQQILQNSQSRVDTSGEILNWDKELIKVHDYYDSQNLALDKMLVNSQRAYAKDSTKSQQIEQAINSTRITLHNNMINELSKIDDKYFSEGMAKVAELNAKYSDSMDLDTRSNALKKVVDEFSKLREQFKNDPIISQEMLDKWQENQTLKVNWEFDNKDLEEWGKLNDRIQETIDKPFNGKNTRSIQAELEKRIDIIKRLLEQLSRATGQPFDQAEFDRLSTELKTKSTEKYNTEQAKKDIQDYVTIANNGLNSVFTNLKSNIDEFGFKFESVIFALGESVSNILSQMSNKGVSNFMDSLTTISENGKTQWQNMDSSQKKNSAIGAGLGMAGSLVSSMAPKSSVGGQAVGGALSGAAAGTAIMPGIGTAIGAGVGFLAGALSGAKNKRQEKIIQEQLEEQKKANVLLERMSALTYASQIIGQKTEYGIVSGVRRNEFGQIVSVVQGQDIIMVADRTNKQKQR